MQAMQAIKQQLNTSLPSLLVVLLAQLQKFNDWLVRDAYKRVYDVTWSAACTLTL